MNDLERQIRHSVYQHFLDSSVPPMLEEIMTRHRLAREETAGILESLETQKGLALLRGTQRILMAWPFSAVATPFSVKLENSKQYFANCAYDAVAFYAMLEQPLEINSYCHQSGETITARIGRDGRVDAEPPDTLVYLARPASKWWDDIVDTCSNTMVFFAGKANLEKWLATHAGTEPGQVLSIEQIIELSRPIYKNRMELDYERPPADVIRQHFARMGLTGSFWAI